MAKMRMQTLGTVRRPENIIGNDESSGNCYAKACPLGSKSWVAMQLLRMLRPSTPKVQI